MRYIIITGSPVDGLEFYGPFDTEADAINAANTDPHLPTHWWIAPLHSLDDESMLSAP
jgi:hypothetical protein